MNAKLPPLLSDLRKRVRGEVRDDLYTRTLYSTDASIYQVMPYAVFIPRAVEEVAAAVTLAAQYGVPVLPRGAGSSLVGQAVNEALVIDMTRHLDRVLEVNAEARWVRVQPGVVLDTLNAQLRPHGLQFGPDPASSNRATLGGITGNNSTGSHSIMYGMTADHVLEAGVMLDDGSHAHFGPLDAAQLPAQRAPGRAGAITREIHALTQAHAETIRAGTPRHWRRCGGYNLDRFVDGPTAIIPQDTRFNLAKLLCGSEGTLGVMTEIKLNLVPRPKMTALAIVPFSRLVDALEAVPVILETGPSAVELLDNLGLTRCREVPEYARLVRTFVHGEPNCVLITEFYGESEAELHGKIDHLRARLQGQLVPHGEIVPALAPQLQANVWTVRKVGLGFLMSVKGDFKPVPFIEDAAVPPEHLAEYITRVEQFCRELGTEVAYYAHASAGCLHVRPLMNTKTASEIAKLPEIAQFSVELLGDYGGAFSSEHGDGRARSWLNEAFFGPELYALYRQVKNIFDPQNIFNPGNIVDGGPMTENLRYGPTYQPLPLHEHLDFRADQGFVRAVEMCNGAGICRKRTTGVMCPSFMATRDEQHSTRGRANLLRAALTGHLPPAELTGLALHEAMDLCISCKACKAECPSSVDMAKIKLEYQAHYYEIHKIPLRSRLFASIAALNRWGSRVPSPLTGALLRWQPVRWLMEAALGISAQRELPAIARQSFTAWWGRRPKTDDGRPKAETRSPVVLFADPFNTYNDPHIAIAATEVLEAAGYEVLLSGHKCCGRPAMSKGLIRQARAAARDTVNKLAPFAERGIPIVGLEPSSLLSLRDEYAALLPGDPRVAQIAAHAFTFEEFISNLAQEGKLNLAFTNESRELLLHGHCHQKALVGTQPARHTLTLPPNYTLVEVDAACCGMAGSFGYEAEHQEISAAMAERRLMPAVREAVQHGATVAASGTSCRQQITHFTGVRALHPAEVVRGALVG